MTDDLSDYLREIYHSEIEPCRAKLRAYAHELTRDKTRAEDLLQSTLIKACISLHSYTPGTNAYAWCRIIMKHLHISESMRLARLKPLEVLAPIPDDSRRNDQHGRYSDEVTRGLNALDPELRILIKLRDEQDHSYEDICKLLDLSLGTVKSRLYRARRILQAMLSDYAARAYGIN